MYANDPYDFYSEFQLVFCATVCAIVVGGAAERGRLLPIIPFIFVCFSLSKLLKSALTTSTY